MSILPASTCVDSHFSAQAPCWLLLLLLKLQISTNPDPLLLELELSNIVECKKKRNVHLLQALLCALLAGYHKLLHRVLQIDRFMATGHKRTAYPKPNWSQCKWDGRLGPSLYFFQRSFQLKKSMYIEKQWQSTLVSCRKPASRCDCSTPPTLRHYIVKEFY